MEHVNSWCFRGIYKGGLWEDDLHVSAHNVFCYLLYLRENDLDDTDQRTNSIAPAHIIRPIVQYRSKYNYLFDKHTMTY